MTADEVGPGILLRIYGNTFVALAQLTKRGHVTWAAPSIKMMERWERKKVEQYCYTRGWRIEEVRPHP